MTKAANLIILTIFPLPPLIVAARGKAAKIAKIAKIAKRAALALFARWGRAWMLSPELHPLANPSTFTREAAHRSMPRWPGFPTG